MTLTKNKIKTTLLVAAGTAAVVLGTIGIFLPVLPTTPFLLLAAYCFARSSQKLYRMLMQNRLFGTFLRNYLEGKGMSLRYKCLTLGLLWLVMGATGAFATNSTAIRITLLVVAAGVTIHILSLKAPSNRVLAVEIKPKQVD
jgi:uncharacterized membrane protein YbaN (DUF454 family)